MTSAPESRWINEKGGCSASEDHWVLEYTLHATLSAAVLVGSQTIEGTGQEVSFEGVDIVRVSNGQVTSKDSYIDGFAVLAQLT